MAAAELHTRLQESDHRIKNHLQLLSAALSVQARGLGDETSRQALLEACGHVAAVARLHARLQEVHASDVEMSPFLTGLCDDLHACFGVGGAPPLRLDVDVDDGSLPAKSSLTVALIVNELVTNAVKYAGGGDGCAVHVGLRRDENIWRLTVSDNGPGLSPETLEMSVGLGARLLHALARQLGGHVELDAVAAGASVSVVFAQNRA